MGDPIQNRRVITILGALLAFGVAMAVAVLVGLLGLAGIGPGVPVWVVDALFLISPVVMAAGMTAAFAVVFYAHLFGVEEGS